MDLTNRNARVAGIIYLLLVLAAPLRLIIIPGKLFVPDNASATAANIAAHETLFRLGMVADLFAAIVLVFVTLAFYRLFHDVDRNLAALVVILGGVMPAILYFVNVAFDAVTLLLVRGGGFLSVVEIAQREAFAMLFLRLHSQLVVAAETLWGIWLFPLAILIFKSRFLPRFLSVWLFLNGLAYIAASFTGLLLPNYQDTLAKFSAPAQFGEVALVLWLLVFGAKPRKK